jgi:hypothetical protein
MIVLLDDIPPLKVIITKHRTFLQKAAKGEGGYWVNGKKVPDEIVRKAMRMMNE